jgi:ABC-2 type transport system permease protein
VTSRLAPYAAVVGARYRMLLQYRAAAAAGAATQVFWGAIKLMVLAAFYSQSAGGHPLTWPQVAAYVWLGQALLGLLPWNVDRELAAQIRTGDVAYELLRPVGLYGYWFARTMAFRTATASLRMIPIFALAMVVLPLAGLGRWALPPPAGAASGLWFAASLGATVLLATAITMVMHVALVRTLAGEGLNGVMPGLVAVLSGMVVPLPLFPEPVQGVLAALPFRGLVDVPFRIWSGSIPPAEAAAHVVQQVLWAAAFVMAGRTWLCRSLRRVVVQGG